MCLRHIQQTSAKLRNPDWDASPLKHQVSFCTLTVYKSENKHIVEDVLSQKKYWHVLLFTGEFSLSQLYFYCTPSNQISAI